MNQSINQSIKKTARRLWFARDYVAFNVSDLTVFDDDDDDDDDDDASAI